MRNVGLCAVSMSLVWMFAGCEPVAQTPPAVAPKISEDPASETTTTPTATADPLPPQAEVPADDAAAIAALEKLAKNVKRDSQGVIVELDFRNSEVKDEDLTHLSGLVGLQSLLLNESQITDAGLESVGKVSTLRNLDLRGCNVSNAGMAHLTPLTGLRALRLSGQNGATAVDDDGLEHIGKLTSLKALLLDFLWVSGEGLSKLEGLGSLEELYLAGTLVADEDLEQVKLFPKLKKLRISKLSQVTGAGLQHVQELKQLIDLDLSENSSLFDADMEPLKGMTTLERLNLWRVALTNQGVAHLSDLTRLQWLNLDNTQLTDEGLDALQNMQELTFLHLGSTGVTNDGLSKLSGLKKLKDLKVTRTAVTEEGVAELKKSLPDTEIQLKYLGDE